MAGGPLHSGLQNRSPLCLATPALKGEPLTRETASKTDENDSLLRHECFLQLLGLRHRRSQRSMSLAKLDLHVDEWVVKLTVDVEETSTIHTRYARPPTRECSN